MPVNGWTIIAAVICRPGKGLGDVMIFPQDTRRLWVRYAIGLTLLVAMLLGGHAIHVHTLKAGAADAETIDLSGRQRMLSQRMAGLAAKLADPEMRPIYEAALVSSLTLFEDSHALLLDRQAAFPSAARVYAVGQPDGLDAQVKAFSADVRAALSLDHDDPQLRAVLARLDGAAFAPLLTALDDAVKGIAADAQARHADLQQVQVLALAFSLLLIAIEAVAIFWPAQRSVNRAMDTARRRSQELETKNADLRALSNRLEHSTLHDQLTGLANRKHLQQELDIRLARPAQQDHVTCVMHVDLDGFKDVNDTLGHAAGDCVLRRAAEAMRYRTRAEDLVARVGGDEFVIVSDIYDAGDGAGRAQQIAEGIVARLREPMVIDRQTVTVGASIGYTFADRSQDPDPDRLVSDADIALYEAKRAGKGIAVLFDTSMRSGVERRHALIRDIERAVDANEFVPFLQPQIETRTGAVLGFEVLTRWNHPERGILPPAEFLDLAEESGIVDVIDRQAAFGGLDALIALRKAGHAVPSISINASSVALRNPDFAADLRLAVAMRGLRPADVRIEIVESTLIADVDERATRSLQTLAAEGFRVDLDDFGTGYASLALLSKLEISGLKIDRHLVLDIENPRARKVVEAIIGLARGLSLDIVGEGVETAAQLKTLQALGCPGAQGFGIGVPMALDAAVQWLDRRTDLWDGTQRRSAP